MLQLNFDTTTLVCQELHRNRSFSDLRSVANVCRSWRSAALPFLFRNINVNFSSERAIQLEDLHSSPLNQHSPYRHCVRQIQFQGSERLLLKRHLDHLIKGISSLPNLSHFNWFFQGNIPRGLLSALNDHSSLHSIHLWLYNRSKRELNIADISSSTTKSLSLVIDDEQSSKTMLDSRTLPTKDGPDLFLNTDAILDYCEKHGSRLASINPVSVRIPKRPCPGVASLVLYQIDIRLWQKVASSHPLDLCNLKRLALIRCDNPMLISWPQYPRDLETLEIVHPHQTYPYKAGLVLSDNLLANPLSHFRNLSELNLQHVGGPICEVLFNLVEIGKQLKVLKLHDEAVEGIDRLYWIQRSQPQPHSDCLECPFWKFLVYTCPNVEILSLDISDIALQKDDMNEFKRASDSRSIALEPILEGLEQVPTLGVFETLRSLRYLRSLRIMTLDTGDTARPRSEANWIPVSKKLWSADFESFILTVTFVASRSRDVMSVEDVVRIDMQQASSLDIRHQCWRAISGFHLDAKSL